MIHLDTYNIAMLFSELFCLHTYYKSLIVQDSQQDYDHKIEDIIEKGYIFITIYPFISTGFFVLPWFGQDSL